MRIPLQAAFLTGQSDPPGAALTPAQTAFLAALPLPEASRVASNFPYPAGPPAAFRPVPLAVASVRNARQYLAARRRDFADRHVGAVKTLLARADHTVFLAGSCGLELFNGLSLAPEDRRRVTIFAYGPVARRRPEGACLLVQGRGDWLSRWYFPQVDVRVAAGHMDYLADPTVVALAQNLIRQLSGE